MQTIDNGNQRQALELLMRVIDYDPILEEMERLGWNRHEWNLEDTLRMASAAMSRMDPETIEASTRMALAIEMDESYIRLANDLHLVQNICVTMKGQLEALKAGIDGFMPEARATQRSSYITYTQNQALGRRQSRFFPCSRSRHFTSGYPVSSPYE